MGPGAVRVQAAVEAVVYASAMTPLHITCKGTNNQGRHCGSIMYIAVRWLWLGVVYASAMTPQYI